LEVNRDITVRKQMEQGLRESRDQLAMTQRIAQAGNFDLDLRTNVVVCSEELQRLYGMAPGQARLDMDVWVGWILPEDREQALADIAAGIESGEVRTQFRIRRRDTGEIRWIDRRGQVLRDERGLPARLLGFSIDITEQKTVEEKLRQSMQRERIRSAELEAVMNAIPGVIFVAHDRECRNVVGNQPAYELLRREPGSNLSRSAPKKRRARQLSDYQ
jgi:PAS domain S-box-containing protein